MRIPAVCVGILAALMVSATAFGQVVDAWTAVASTGASDESNGANWAFGPTTFGYRAGSMSVVAIAERFNVTNTGHGMEQPNWNTLELGNFDNYAAAGTYVQATLYKVDPCTGVQNALCSVTSSNAAAAKCNTCQFAAGSIDFTQYLYYVLVVVSRANANDQPTARTIRIY
jgi:hypothetical protein